MQCRSRHTKGHMQWKRGFAVKTSQNKIIFVIMPKMWLLICTARLYLTDHNASFCTLTLSILDNLHRILVTDSLPMRKDKKSWKNCCVVVEKWQIHLLIHLFAQITNRLQNPRNHSVKQSQKICLSDNCSSVSSAWWHLDLNIHLFGKRWPQVIKTTWKWKPK